MTAAKAVKAVKLYNLGCFCSVKAAAALGTTLWGSAFPGFAALPPLTLLVASPSGLDWLCYWLFALASLQPWSFLSMGCPKQNQQKVIVDDTLQIWILANLNQCPIIRTSLGSVHVYVIIYVFTLQTWLFNLIIVLFSLATIEYKVNILESNQTKFSMYAKIKHWIHRMHQLLDCLGCCFTGFNLAAFVVS